MAAAAIYPMPPYLWGISLSHTGGRAPSPDPKLTKGGAQKKPPRKENRRTNQFSPRPRSHLLPSQIRRSHDFVRFPPLKKGFIFPSTQKWEGFLGNAPISRLSLPAVYIHRTGQFRHDKNGACLRNQSMEKRRAGRNSRKKTIPSCSPPSYK